MLCKHRKRLIDELHYEEKACLIVMAFNRALWVSESFPAGNS